MPKAHENPYEELRDTLSQYARILRRRWRWGFVALSLLGSLAFWCSLYIPRQYRAATVFQRRDDAVLQDLVRQNSAYGFDQLKTSLSLDATGMRARANAAMAIGLLPAGSISAQGALTPSEMQTLDSVLGEKRITAEARLNVTTSAFDVIELRVDANDPEIARRFVTALRDQYIADTRRRIDDVLLKTRTFFESELERCRTQAAASAAELERYFADSPGPVGRDPAAVSQRLDTTRGERDRLAQELARLEAQISARTDFLAAGAAQPAAAPPGSPPAADALADGFERAVRKVEDEIVEAIVVRQMTREHPSVRALERKRDALREVYTAAASQPAASQPVVAGSGPQKSPLTSQVELELDALRRQQSVILARHASAEETMRQYETLYQKLMTHGAELHRLEERRLQDEAAAGVWRQHLAQLNKVTAAESGEHGTQFALIEEPKNSGRALAPRLSGVATVCSGIGLAAAALLIALIELFDRSISDPTRFSQLTGVPLLQSIGVIPTPRENRRRLVRACVWAPALLLCTASLVLSAGLAYASIERPDLERRARILLEPILQPLGLPPIAGASIAPGEDG
jgi:uncharacterized protein involved in exopolysaccharide biosynthesis